MKRENHKRAWNPKRGLGLAVLLAVALASRGGLAWSAGVTRVSTDALGGEGQRL